MLCRFSLNSGDEGLVMLFRRPKGTAAAAAAAPNPGPFCQWRSACDWDAGGGHGCLWEAGAAEIKRLVGARSASSCTHT
jgi:hypothetical protein